MPELPEVETIRLGLQKKIVGLSLTRIQILNPKSFQTDPNIFLGATVSGVVRRAKVLGIEFDNGYTLVFHLKMSGQVIWLPNSHLPALECSSQASLTSSRFVGGHPTKDMLGDLPNNSTRVILEFSDGSKVYFNDQRKFGWIKGIKNEELKIMNYGMKNTIGPEPLEKDFSWEILKQNLIKHKTQDIKVALLDQSTVAGVGNIYASEACFNSGINPQKKVKDLTDDDFKKIHIGIVKAISDGIKYGGSTRTHFVNAEGKKGLFLDYAGVYNRVGSSCKICQTIIIKITSGGRGTFFCPNCQK